MCCVVASPQHQPQPQNQVVHATTPTPHQLQHNPQVGVVHHALQPLCFFMVVVQWWVCCMVDAIVLALSHRCCAFWCVVVHPISPSPLTHHLVHPSHTHIGPCTHTTTVPFGVTFTTTTTPHHMPINHTHSWVLQCGVVCVHIKQQQTQQPMAGCATNKTTHKPPSKHTPTTNGARVHHTRLQQPPHTTCPQNTHAMSICTPNSTNTTPHASTMPTITPRVTTQTRHMLTTTTLCQHTQLHQPPCCQVQTHQTHCWQLAPLVNIANKLIQPIPQQTTHTTKSQTCARLHNTTTTPHLWFVAQPSPPASTVVCGKGGLVAPPTSMCPPGCNATHTTTTRADMPTQSICLWVCCGQCQHVAHTPCAWIPWVSLAPWRGIKCSCQPCSCGCVMN